MKHTLHKAFLLASAMAVFPFHLGTAVESDKPAPALAERTDGGKSVLAWHPAGNLLLLMQTPEFGARVVGAEVPVLVENEPLKIDAGQARWAHTIRIEHSGKTYRAQYVRTFAPFVEGDRKRLKVTCELLPGDPLPFGL